MDGNHDIDTCNKVTSATLDEVFKQLNQQNVYLPGILLKPNMILSGKDSINRADKNIVAKSVSHQ